jgi:multisubunit Na+/H+ antiporter MnhC subunit
MIIGRFIGWLLLLAALVVLVRDLIAWLDTGSFGFVAAGQVWFEISPNTLELAQPAIQRHVATWLWDPIVAILTLPAIVVLGVPGVALVLLCRRRERRRRR